MDNLKYFALTYIDLQENLDQTDKNYLGSFIDMASESEIENLLATGEAILSEAGDGGFMAGSLDIGGERVGGIIDLQHLQRVIDNAIKKKGSTSWESGYGAGHGTGIEKGAVGGLAAATVAALIITVSYRIYKRFLSKAARACKNLGGEAKTSCMNKYKMQSKRTHIAQLQKGRSICSKSKKPGKCTASIDKKIRKLKVQLGDV